MYSNTVCPPGYVKKLQSPSLDFALRASAAFASLFKNAPGIFVTKGAAIGQEPRCREAQGCARAAISSFFYYASQANRTTLHAVITMDGVRAGFAWSKNLSNYEF